MQKLKSNCVAFVRNWSRAPQKKQGLSCDGGGERAQPHEVKARRCLENQSSLSPFKWSIFFVPRGELQHGAFNSTGQLELPSCLIPIAATPVCAVTSVGGGEGLNGTLCPV